MKNNTWSFRILVAAIAAGLLLGACGSASSPNEVSFESEGAFSPPEPEMAEDSQLAFEKAAYDEEAAAESYTRSQQAVERLVIKDANLVIVVEDPASSMDAISRMAEDMGGFVVSGSLYQTNTESGAQVPQAAITIRVPAEKLNDALGIIRAESDQAPLSEGVSSQDVTSEYVDLESRLTNLEAAEAQLQVIMDDANKTEDVLSVYNELVRVREEIEVIKGRMKYLEQSAAMSSIHTELMADEAVQPLTVGNWQPTGVAKGAVQALIDALKFLANLGIWVLIFVLPIALILFVVVFLPVRWVVRRVRGRRKKSNKGSTSHAATSDPQEPDKT